MRRIPASIRNLLARRKPRITCPDTADTLARIITRTQLPTHPRDTPETLDETIIRDLTPDQIARRGEGQ